MNKNKMTTDTPNTDAPSIQFLDYCFSFKPYKHPKELLTALLILLLIPFLFVFLSIYNLLKFSYHAIQQESQKASEHLSAFLFYTLLAPISPLFSLINIIGRGGLSLFNITYSLTVKSSKIYDKERGKQLTKDYRYSRMEGIINANENTRGLHFFSSEDKPSIPKKPDVQNPNSKVKFKAI